MLTEHAQSGKYLTSSRHEPIDVEKIPPQEAIPRFGNWLIPGAKMGKPPTKLFGGFLVNFGHSLMQFSIVVGNAQSLEQGLWNCMIRSLVLLH